MTRALLLAAALTIPAAVIADAAPRKAKPAVETTGVATPDAPTTQTPARRARASVQPAAGSVGLGAGGSNALPGAQSTIQVGDRCFRPTDGRGYGYWASCDQVYTYVLSRGLKARDAEVQSQLDRGSDGGGGDGGGGSGGGQR